MHAVVLASAASGASLDIGTSVLVQKGAEGTCRF